MPKIKLPTYWEKEYIHRCEKPYRTSWSSIYSRFMLEKNLRRYFREACDKIESRPIKVLDLGCETGLNIFMLNSYFGRNYDIEFTGIDLSANFINMACMWKNYRNITNVQFKVGDIENDNLSEECFHIVISIETLEHLRNPKKVVRMINQLLAKGGIAIISTPNENDFFIQMIDTLTFGILRRKVSDEHKQLMAVYPNHAKGLHPEVGYGHISLKSANQWIKIFEKEGFTIEKAKSSMNMVYGGPIYDNKPILFSFIVIIDRIFDLLLPNYYKYSHGFMMSIRKR